MSPWWQYGIAEVLRRLRVTRLSSSAGRSSPSMSRPLSVNQSVLVDRAPVEADDVAHAARDGLEAAAVGLHALDDAVALARLADVARRADRHVELAVGTEGDELPAVVRLAGKRSVTTTGAGGCGEAVVDAVEAQDLRDRGDVEIAVAPGDARRHLQAAGDGAHRAGAAALDLEGVDLAGAAAADVDHALAVGAAAERHLARVRHRVGDELDAKARGQTQLLERQGGLRRVRDAGAERERQQRARRAARHAGRWPGPAGFGQQGIEVIRRSKPARVSASARQCLDVPGRQADLAAGGDDLAPGDAVDRHAVDEARAPSSPAPARPA